MYRKFILVPLFIVSYLFARAQLQPEDTCLDAYFHRLYGYRTVGTLSSITETSDKKLLWCGSASQTNTSSTADGDAVIVKLRNNGTVIWSKSVGGAYFDEFNRARENRDKTIVAVGSTNFSVFQGSNLLISKLDSDGNLLWSKKINDPNVNNPTLVATDVAETNDGGYFICGYSLADNYGVVLKTDADGNLLWFKELGMTLTYGPANFNSVVLHNDTAFVTGWFTDNFHKNGLLMKINANTGVIYWTKHYDYKKSNPATGNSTNNIFKNINILNGQLRINMVSELNDPMEAWMINMDYDGQVLKTRRLASPSPENIGLASTEYPTTDDGFISASSHFLSNSYVLSLVKVDADGNLAWSKAYTLTKGHHTFGAFVNSNNDIFLTGYEVAVQPASPFYCFLFKTDKEGNIPGSSCTNYAFSASVGAGTLSVTDLTWQQSGNLTPVNGPYTTTSAIETSALIDDCSSLKPCNQVKIIHTVDSICNLEDTLQYAVQRNTGCSLPVTWEVDTAIVSIIETTDSTIRLLFKQAGTVKLYASLISACKIMEDSIELVGMESPGVIDLGPDVGICTLSQLTLIAGNGFKSYEWSDGSTAATLTVFNPGKYFVTAEDYCHTIHSDTIQVTLAPDIPFDLGPDLEKCENDTLNIVAPGNFQSYTWSPSYAISSTNSNNIQVWPAIDTSYSVIAEVTGGCTVFDTVRITVKKSPPIYLGSDTSFCYGSSILLSAPAGFNDYRWSNGELGQNIVATQQGLYSVLATYTNGCFSKDTLEIKNVFPLPVVDLGKDFDICINQTHTFNAGNNLTSWLWQDGSMQSTYLAQQPGIYWVLVKDFNNCANSDTVAITGLKPAPENFSAPDTMICPGSTIELKASGVWASYLWNNQSRTPAITVTEPGDYWLQVTNADGCIAKDTIRVSEKDCKKGIYFPNTFTPDNNGHNDTYRPVVRGLLDKFRLLIYNRYGEKVFETTNYRQGWNGVYNGQQQNVNQFVWVCYYQFRGEKEQMEKGVVILLR